MFKSYLKIAFRNMLKYKGHSFINITGIAIGMACFILIMLWVQDELSFDTFHKEVDNLYRLSWKTNNESKYMVATPAPLAAVIKDECPGIINSTRYANSPWEQFKTGEKELKANAIFADAEFFNVFTFPFVHGDVNTALDDPSSIIFTEELARKYFKEDNPVGKMITMQTAHNREYQLKITGIIENIPDNSHLQTDVIISMDFWNSIRNMNYWGDYFTNTYVHIRENQNLKDVKSQIEQSMQKYMDEGGPEGLQVFLQPLEDIHLHSNFRADRIDHGDIKYVYLFSIVAIFILVIACINYMNLETARSIKRSREIGLRKVVGANRLKIVIQFLSESFCFIMLAFIIALLLAEISLPYFGAWVQKNLAINYLSARFIFGAIGVISLTGLVAAAYPAFFISVLNPAKTLKENTIFSSKGGGLRKVLVALQFSLSIIIIIGSITVSNQLNFMRKANLGYNRENLLYVKLQGDMIENYETIKNELLQYPDVISVTANQFINAGMNTTNSITWEGKPDDADIDMTVLRVDYDFLKTYQLGNVAGRFYSREFATDATDAYVINEAAVKAMGLKEPVGKRFSLWGYRGKIIGVVKDFHFKSLHETIKPMILWPNTEKNYWNFEHLTVRIKSHDIPNTMNSIERLWKKHSPNYSFEYSFFDKALDAQYKVEQRIGKIFNWFTTLAIVISCLGLLGLISFIVNQKTKEIGVRKVLGASVSNIVGNLVNDFTRWILFSNIIAWPIAWYAMNNWLQNFAYRIEISWWMFAMAGAIALTIALITVSWQAIWAATANPVKVLRYE